MDSGKISKFLIVLLILGFIPFTASVSQIDVLVVDDGHNITNYDKADFTEGMFHDEYLESLNSISGVNAEVMRTNYGPNSKSGPPVSTLKEYDTVVWYTLSDNSRSGRQLSNIETTLTDTDESRLKEFISKHEGAFYFTGHRISWDIGVEEDQSGENFYRKYLGVKANPESRYRAKIKDNGQIKGNNYDDVSLTEMTYDDRGNLALGDTGSGIFSSGTVFNINTTREPAGDFRLISDICDDRFSDEYELNCANRQESLRWLNNKPLKDATGDVKVKNVNSNSKKNTKALGVSFSSGGENRVLLVGTLTLKSSQESSKIKSAVTDGGRELRKINQVENGNFTNQVYILKGPPTSGKVYLNASNATHIAATTVTLNQAAKGVTIGVKKSNASDQSTTLTNIKNEEGEKVIDFISSKNSLTANNSQTEMDNTGIGNNNAKFYGFKDEGTGTLEMKYKNGENYTQLTLNIERDATNAEYVFEQDGSLSNNGDSDEYATAHSTFFNNSYRTAVSSFGFESIKWAQSRKRMMKQTIRYLTGPIANQTVVKASNNDDIPYTRLDESKYTDNYVDLNTVGNNDANPSKISDFRFFYNYSSIGMGPAIESSMENKSQFLDNWNVEQGLNADYDIDDECGVIYGDRALRLEGTELIDVQNGKVEISTQEDLSKASNVTLQFWLMAPDSENAYPCEGPNEGDYLKVKMKPSDGESFQTLDKIYAENLVDGTWYKYETSLEEQDLSSTTEIAIKKPEGYGQDAWLLDDISIIQEGDIGSQIYNSNNLPVSVSGINLTDITADLSNKPTGYNVSVGVQFKDSSQQGYWGATEKTWAKVDTQPPAITSKVVNTFSSAKDYTKNKFVNFSFDTTASSKYQADLIRLSCDTSKGWSRWKQLNRSQQEEIISFDVTNSSAGCSSSQGNRTVYADFRDYAGNKPPETPQDWVIYDTSAPSYEGASPSNLSAIQSNKEIFINGSDNFEITNPLTSYFNGSQNISFTPNVSFDPQFSSEGEKRGLAYLFDKAFNLNKVSVFYDVDDTPPSSSITPKNKETPTNNSVVRSEFNLTINISDRNFDQFTVNDGDNTTYSNKDVEFDPNWTEGASKDLVLWMEDTAGNRKVSNYIYDVDDTPPVKSASKFGNQTYILNSTKLGYNFTDSITSVESITVSETKIGGLNYDVGIETDWETEGEHYLIVNASDPVNKRVLNFTYTVDETRPETSIYYDSYTPGTWTGSNVSFSINATDNMNMSKIFYCKRNAGGSCTLDSESLPDKNVSAEIKCKSGNTCEREVKYNSRDSAGNRHSSSADISSVISIDKEKPSLTNLRPAGGTVSGNVTISADISDSGSGVNDTNFTIYNSSDSAQVYESGSLSYKNGEWRYEWDSKEDISTSGDVTLNISVSDKLGYKKSSKSQFRVDNQRVTVQIRTPFREIVKENFRLNVTANSPGSGNLSSHNYSIEDGATEIYSNQTTSLNSDSHRYDLSFDTGKISNDGNYTLNITAKGDGGEYATSESWFYLDREAPEVQIESPSNQSWSQGEVIIDFKAFDLVKNGTLTYEYRDEGGSWTEVGISYGQDNFTFDTAERCNNDHEADCEIRVKAVDAAGNVNSSLIQLKIDNSEPSVSIDSPGSLSWQNGDFNVERTVKDSVAEKSASGLSCSYKINTGSYQSTTNCNTSISVDIPADCENLNTDCYVKIKASNPAGLTSTSDRTFQIDTNQPLVEDNYPKPASGTIINANDTIKFFFKEDFSGISYSLIDDGNNRQSISEGEGYEPKWTDSGQKTLYLELNDSADNFKENSYDYTFDNEQPEINDTEFSKAFDTQFGEVRVYRGEELRLNVSVLENIKMEKVSIKVNNSGSVESYQLETLGDLQNATWRTSLPTQSTGFYNITQLKLVDKAGNILRNTSITGYRVVNYSQTVEMGGDTVIDAGQQESFNLSVNFNRTVGERKLELYIPPSTPSSEEGTYYTLSGVSCEIVDCNVSLEGSHINLNYSGDRKFINVTGTIYAKTEENNRDSPFTSTLYGNIRRSSALLKAPELEVGNMTLSSELDLEVKQFSKFNLTADVLNNKTSSNTGKAFDVELSISSNSSNNPVEKSKLLGNLSSSALVDDEKFRNLSFGQAGTFQIEAIVEDGTEAYSDTAAIDVRVLDVVKPNISNTRPTSKRIYVNNSIILESDITDNEEVESVNLTLKLPNGSNRVLNMSRTRNERFITSFNETSDKGTYNITRVEASDQRGNEKIVYPGSTFQVTQLRMDVNVTDTQIKNSEAVNFTVNITGNSSDIRSVKINSTSPKGEYLVSAYRDVKNVDNLTFDKFENSGNYSFNVTVSSGFEVTNQTRDVFVEFGDSSINPLSGENGTVILPDGSDIEVPWMVKTDNGSIRDVTIRFSSADSTILTAPVSTEDIGNVTAVEKEQINQFTVSPENTGNTTIDLEADPQNGTKSSTTLDVWVKNSETESPDIESVNISDEILNLGENQIFSVSVREKSIIKNVTLNVVSNKTGKTWKIKMNRTAANSFRYNLTNTESLGGYNYTVKAYDISGNIAKTKDNFTVSDEYNIQVSSDQEIYVKGDLAEFDVEVLDMSGDEVTNYDGKFIMTKGENEKTIATGFIESASEPIYVGNPPSKNLGPSNLPVTYDIEVNITKGENSGLYTGGIDVTRRLEIRDYRAVEDFVEKGGNFTVKGRWIEPSGQRVGGRKSSYLNCRKCETEFKEFTLVNKSTRMRKQTFQVPNGTESVIVKAYISTTSGNSESQAKNDAPPFLDVEIGGQGTSTNGSTGAGGFGAIGGGGPRMTITRISPNISIGSNVEQVNLSVRTDLSAKCRYTPNPVSNSFPYNSAEPFTNTGGKMHYSMVDLKSTSSPYSYSILCSSENVNQTAGIFFSRNDTEVSSFRPSLPRSITRGNNSITQMKNGSGSFRIFNQGGEPLRLEFNVMSECCKAWVEHNGGKVRKAVIPGQQQEEFSIEVHPPLSAERGVHSLMLTISGENATINRTVSFDIDRSKPVQRYYQLKSKASILNASIDRYRMAGIDTSKMRKLFEDLQRQLELANKSIEQDKRQELKEALKIGYNKAGKIDRMLENARFKKYVLMNWWKWAAGFVGIYMAFFLVVMVGIPYYRIRTELTRINSQLDNAVQARKKGEKQYFKRQIDKDTFNSMMQERQNEVLELRGEKEDLKEELDGFLWSQLTLENYLKAPWKGMKELEKWWAANRRARENLGSDESNEGDE